MRIDEQARGVMRPRRGRMLCFVHRPRNFAFRPGAGFPRGLGQDSPAMVMAQVVPGAACTGTFFASEPFGSALAAFPTKASDLTSVFRSRTVLVLGGPRGPELRGSARSWVPLGSGRQFERSRTWRASPPGPARDCGPTSRTRGPENLLRRRAGQATDGGVPADGRRFDRAAVAPRPTDDSAAGPADTENR